MKKLITDQLIEEYQKELEIAEKEYKLAKYSIDYCKKRQGEEKVENILTFITRLQSLRQEEVQNIKDARDDGYIHATIGWEDIYTPYIYSELNSNDYFTQTFQQQPK